MTDAELRDAAVARLKQTTVGYRNKHWTIPPAGSNWAQALALLERIGAAPEPEPEPPLPAGIPVPPGQLLAKLSSASAGDVLRLTGGVHPYATLNRSFGEPRVTVTADPDSPIVGIDTGGQSGYVFDGIRAERPVEFSNYDISCFYLHGASRRIRLHGATLKGGGVTLKVYCNGPAWAEEIEVIDCDISGGGVDLTHWNGARSVTIADNKIHDPAYRAGSHQDAIQAVRMRDFTISRNFITAPQIAGGNSQGMMLGSTVQYGETRSLINGKIESNRIENWLGGRPIILTCCDQIQVTGNTIQRNGTVPSITFDPVHGPVSNVLVHRNLLQSMYKVPGAQVVATENTLTNPDQGNFE